ncbi:MAG: hypothetical protein QOJ31_1815 [Gaiellales bacterium]|nr:hypothetical protein [Gaiellales bacterium]MDX6551131.1 hypothetical protein [Gaiellales bacterium]
MRAVLRLLMLCFAVAAMLPVAALAGTKPGAPPAWTTQRGTIHAAVAGARYVSYHNGSRCTFHPDRFHHRRSLPYTCSGHRWDAGAAATYRIFVGRATKVYVTSTLTDLEGAHWTSFTSWTRQGRYVTVKAYAGLNSGTIRAIHLALRWD